MDVDTFSSEIRTNKATLPTQGHFLWEKLSYEYGGWKEDLRGGKIDAKSAHDRLEK